MSIWEEELAKHEAIRKLNVENKPSLISCGTATTSVVTMPDSTAKIFISVISPAEAADNKMNQTVMAGTTFDSPEAAISFATSLIETAFQVQAFNHVAKNKDQTLNDIAQPCHEKSKKSTKGIQKRT